LENPTGDGPDYHTAIPNQIGIGLLQARRFDLAQQLYQSAAAVVCQVRTETGKPLHAGAYFATAGWAYLETGDIDRAAIMFHYTAAEDKVTYGHKSTTQSAALNKFWNDIFRRPTLDEAFTFLEARYPSTTPRERKAARQELERAVRSLGKQQFTLLANMHELHLHAREYPKMPNPYSAFKILGAFRGICALIEVRMKRLSGWNRHGLLSAVANVYKEASATKGSDWSTTFEDEQIKFVKAVEKSPYSYNRQLTNIMRLTQPPKNRKPSDEDHLRQKLICFYATRNFGSHELDDGSFLVRKYPTETYAMLLSVLILVSRYK
jgi:hypothetical protein